MHTMLVNLSRQRRYWLMLLILGIALEAIALFYQYALDYPPCVLCIHIRILVFAFMLLAFLALFCTDSLPTMRLLHGANSLLMMGMVERSWQVLAVERGWTFGDCVMDLGAPSWFAIDKWWPSLFEVQTACGYTPLMFFDLTTMAEALLVISGLLLILSTILFVSSWQE